MKIVALDVPNKMAQFDITESCSGIQFYFGQNNTTNVNIKFEYLSKDNPNQTLYEGKAYELSPILTQLFDFDKTYYPFAQRANLILNNDNKIRVTIDWKHVNEAQNVTSLAYDLTTEFKDTYKSLQIKKESFSVSENVDTGGYDYLILPENFSNIESILSVNQAGVIQQKKQFITKKAFDSLNKGSDDRVYRTLDNQKVKISADDNAEHDYYLIKF